MKKVIGFVLVASMLTSCATFADEEIVEVDKTSPGYLGRIKGLKKSSLGSLV